MIVLDANILLYAYDSASSHHPKARDWVEKAFSATEPVGLPWQTVAAFLRIMTNPRLPGERFTLQEAVAIVDRWLEQANVKLLAPGEDHWTLFRQMAVEGQAPGALISDAHLAALTIEYGGVLQTTDRDFARFPGLRWINPLGLGGLAASPGFLRFGQQPFPQVQPGNNVEQENGQSRAKQGREDPDNQSARIHLRSGDSQPKKVEAIATEHHGEGENDGR